MREKEPQFTVTDRRKFTSEGELREGSESTPSPVPQAIRPEAVAPAPAPAQAVQVELEEPEVMDGDETIPNRRPLNPRSRARSTMPPRAD